MKVKVTEGEIFKLEYPEKIPQTEGIDLGCRGGRHDNRRQLCQPDFPGYFKLDFINLRGMG